MGGGVVQRRRRGRDVTAILPPTTTIRPVPSRARRTPHPRYVLGPKPKRRTELGLLLFGSLLIVALYVIAEPRREVRRSRANIGPFLGIVLGLALVAHMANRWLVPDANAVILPLAALLERHRLRRHRALEPPVRRGSQAGLGPRSGVVLYVLTLLVVRYSRDLERYRYLLLLLAGILLVVSPLFFSPINGARLWVHVGTL